MTYADLIAEIKLLSKRGDIDDKIAIALRMATLRAHRADLFWRDMVEVNAVFAPSTTVEIDVSTAFTRFRALNYMRYLDPTSGELGSFLNSVDPTDVVDEYSCYREDTFYLAGTYLQARFRYQASGARIGYWQNPDVAAATYNSWIKDDLPDLLVQGSLAYLYNMTGKQEEARSINRMCGFEPDPANKAPGMTLLDQLRAGNLRGQMSA